MFKRTILAAIAFSFIAAPMAQAQTRHDPRHPAPQHHHQPAPKPHFQAPGKKPQAHAPAPKRHHWKRGERVAEWKRRPAVRDYHRHGLKRPSKGQQWVKVDNDYLLISVATGLILGIAASR
ncbi:MULTISPECIES: RcnB family protein [unclassified Aminobacter]|uniref:RcnB family protein n=1 Tax=unclassified Aminobacter TaxID=2644704 RepID=UPI0004679764|nr:MULTISPECIES: RcnB family protein [unclassified Aminobacter]TWH35430.1 Ni/Co efflux regulator RcnB [Aminobacter sp. J15]